MRRFDSQSLVQLREGDIQALSQLFEILTHRSKIQTHAALQEFERVILLSKCPKLQP